MVQSPAVPVTPRLIQWAVEVTDVSEEIIDKRSPKWRLWVTGMTQPTFGELEKFSEVVRVPIGYFFLASPPEDSAYRPEFRTFGNRQIEDMSSNLREVLLINQARQDWYREFAQRKGLAKVNIVGSYKPFAHISATATGLREELNFRVENRGGYLSEIITKLIATIEEQGVLVAKSGYAGTATTRRLDPNEFRGFALSDDLAPLIFINGADTKRAQIFSLVHEYLHIGIDRTGLMTEQHTEKIEVWANKVVGEVLAPAQWLLRNLSLGGELGAELSRLSDILKCSPLVVGRSALDSRFIKFEEFQVFEAAYLSSLPNETAGREKSGGGDYYKSKPYQTSRRFAEAIISDAYQRGTTFTQAMRLLQIKSPSKLDRFAASLGKS